MEPITLELMTKYHYLSNLLAVRDRLYYVDTVADPENNDYLQRLHILDPETKEDRVILGPVKRVSVFAADDALWSSEASEDREGTVFSKLDENGEKGDGFFVPLVTGGFREFNEKYWLLEAGIEKDHPDYYLYGEEEKKKVREYAKSEEDYLVLDEYPFFYNGVGFINGKREALFLLNKETGKLTRITSATMAVECADSDGKCVYYLGNDYESMKTMYASVYRYDPETEETAVLYHNEKAYISRVFTIRGKVYAMAAFDTCISGHSFYEVKDGELHLIAKSEWMFYNSIGSDCRYGKTHGSLKKDEEYYLLTTDKERSIVVKFDGEKIIEVTDGEGSVDDMAFIGDELYTIAMKDMKLQEVYRAPEFTQLTFNNEEVLKDRYVAKPERFTCFNEDEIVGWALYPKDYDPNKKYPMILDIHGGPKTAYGEVFYHEMQVWASMGYFVVFCNPHCSDGKGDDFACYIKHYGATDYYDIMAFVDKALEFYPIDPERLGVTGGSYGGYMTNWIITHTDRFKAAASQRSISNRVADFYYSDYSYDTTYENGIPLDEKAIDLFWERSPLKYVENAVTPILFIQSTEDFRCPFPEALQLFSALKWKGVETRICGFKGENHELSRSGKPLHRLRRLREITDWLSKYLNV